MQFLTLTWLCFFAFFYKDVEEDWITLQTHEDAQDKVVAYPQNQSGECEAYTQENWEENWDDELEKSSEMYSKLFYFTYSHFDRVFFLLGHCYIFLLASKPRGVHPLLPADPAVLKTTDC